MNYEFQLFYKALKMEFEVKVFFFKKNVTTQGNHKGLPLQQYSDEE